MKTNEIEWMLNQENAEKKRIARGDRNKVRGGGRVVKMPSDYLSKKEREKMNGEVVSFDQRKFYTWDEFVKFPDDLRVKYVNSILNRYDCGLVNISEIVLGKSRSALRMHLSETGLIEFINSGKGGVSRYRAVGKEKLIRDVEMARQGECVVEQTVEEVACDEVGEPVNECVEEPVVEERPVDDGKAMPSANKNDLNNIALLLQSLVGSGAKLTIEVTL